MCTYLIYLYVGLSQNIMLCYVMLPQVLCHLETHFQRLCDVVNCPPNVLQHVANAARRYLLIDHGSAWIWCQNDHDLHRHKTPKRVDPVDYASTQRPTR